jgi:hypothetical protein
MLAGHEKSNQDVCDFVVWQGSSITVFLAQKSRHHVMLMLHFCLKVSTARPLRI